MGDKPNIIYLGDAVYAEFDGRGVILRTGHHEEDQCTNRIYLESDVLNALNRFFKMCVGEDENDSMG